MAHTLIYRYITWPHEVVYTMCMMTMSDVISLVLFVSWYLIVMEGMTSVVTLHMAHHLQELMADTELYRWDKV